MTTATRSHYDLLGGEVGVLQLVNRFYDLMDELPEAYELRKFTHKIPANLAQNYLSFYQAGWAVRAYMKQNTVTHVYANATFHFKLIVKCVTNGLCVWI